MNESDRRARGLSRRRFLQASAAAAAPLAIGREVRAFAARESPRFGRGDEIRVGLVGCGGRGTGAASQALAADTGTVLVAVADAFEDRVAGCLESLEQGLEPEAKARVRVAPERRFVGFDAYRELVDCGVDVVLLATPPAFRPEHLAYAVAQGKHVFCEKPVAVDAPGVRSVIASAEAARAKALSLVVGFCWRYNVRHRELYARVADGAIGDLRAFYSTYLTGPLGKHPRQPGWSDMEWQLRNWPHMLWLSGDHIVEQAVHSLDKMAWAFGDRPPILVMAVGGRQAREGAESGNIYDHFGCTFEYPGGAKGFHLCRQIENCPSDNNDHLLGEKGTATIKGWEPLHAIEGEHAWRYEGPGNDMYQQEHDELFAAIRAGEPINDGVQGAHSTLLAIMAREAAYTGATITWEQALASQEKLGPESYAWGPVDLRAVPIPGRTRFN
jgi:myo-inositol 2-dehydrogenase/D-chiro-inositol 1-dehydrogenase